MEKLTHSQEIIEVLRVFIDMRERALNEYDIGERIKNNGIIIEPDTVSEILIKLSEDRHLNKEKGVAYTPMPIKDVDYYLITEKGRGYFFDLSERRILKKMVITVRN